MGLETVPEEVPDTDTSPSSPVNVGCETLPCGVKLPVDVMLLPVNFNSAPVPVNVGWVVVAVFTLVAIVWLENVGSVTDVGVFGVKLPATQPIVNVSLATLVVMDGIVALAAVPAVTTPPPVALDATYFDAVFNVTVVVG